VVKYTITVPEDFVLHMRLRVPVLGMMSCNVRGVSFSVSVLWMLKARSGYIDSTCLSEVHK